MDTWTKYKSACHTLDLEYEHTIFDIKTQYRAKALLYHPDKCQEEGAVARFQEVQAAYEYLKGYKETPLDGRSCSGTGGIGGTGFKNIIGIIMHKMSQICEKKTRQLLEGFDLELLEKLIGVLKLYPAIPETIREMVKEVIDLRRGQTERIIINPVLDDILCDNLYPYVRDGKTYILPLWHHELVYDVEGVGGSRWGSGGGCAGEMVIQIIPILPDNVAIDADNNLHVYLTYRLLDLWESRMGLVEGHDGGWIKFYMGNRGFVISLNQICMTEKQTLVLCGQGISRICHTDIYDVSQRSDVVVHLSIYNE